MTNDRRYFLRSLYWGRCGMGDTNQVALVTGATGAIGKAIARQIAEQNYEVVLAVRNEKKAKKAVDDIARATGNNAVRYELY